MADEHYVATLLAAYDMGNTSDHIGLSTFTDWWKVSGWHPREFHPGDAPVGLLIPYMRSRIGPAKCVSASHCLAYASPHACEQAHIDGYFQLPR